MQKEKSRVSYSEENKRKENRKPKSLYKYFKVLVQNKRDV